MGDWTKGGVDDGGAPFDLEAARGPAWLIDLCRRRIVGANAAALRLWSADSADEMSVVELEAAFFDQLLSHFALGLGAGALVPTRLRSPTRDDVPAVDCLAVPARLSDGSAGLILEAIGLEGELVTVYDGATGAALLRNQRAAEGGRPDERLFADRFVDKPAAERLWRAVADAAAGSTSGRRAAAVARLEVFSGDGVAVHEVRLGLLAGGGAARVVAEERPAAPGAGRPAIEIPDVRPAEVAAVDAGGLPGARRGTVLSVRIGDLDALAEHLGRPAVATLVEATAQRLAEHVRPTDTVAAHGGGRFLAVLPGLADAVVRERRIEQVLRHLSVPIEIGGSQVTPFVSVGHAVWPEHGTSIGELERVAETGGRSSRPPPPRRRPAVSAGPDELRQAIESGEIEAFFQPLVGLDDGRVIGCEALARWRRPRNRPVAAGKFIAAIEAAGLIWPLGDVILRHALRQFGAWTEQGLNAGGRIAINIGAQQLTNVAIVDHVQACLSAAGLSPQNLAVEVNEAIALGPAGDVVVERLNALHDLGVEVVLDDFGTGHAALALLQRLPVNRVKIDRTVVAGIGVVPSCEPIIRTVTDLAHSLSLQVVGEGVETREQMHFLQLCGCDGGQGNLFAAPMPGGEATAWLANRLSPAAASGSTQVSVADGEYGPGTRLGGRGQLH